MSRPLTSDSVLRKIGAVRGRTNQLERRPALSSVNITYPIKVFTDTTVVTTGDGKFIFVATSQEKIHGLNLIAVSAYVTTVSSSGLPTVQIRRVRSGTPVDMLTTKLSIDASEFSSDNAATAAVINTSNDDIALNDQIAIDVDIAGTGAKGLGVTLVFG